MTGVQTCALPMLSMADNSPQRRFTRIERLPPYVFNITAELKMAARRRGEDIIDFSMGNPDRKSVV